MASTLHCSGNPVVSRENGSNATADSGSSSGGGGSELDGGGAGGSGGLFNVGSGGGGAGGMDGGDGGLEDVGCGNARIEPGEACDDGNSESADGCSADCKTIEKDFACPTPGESCVSTVECGDGRITGEETCDDGNSKSQDGCSADCEIEEGYSCPVAGARCEATECGDGIIAGNEQCEDDDDPPADDDGCSASCRLEPGYVCETAGMACRETVCNDGTKEGSEPCDDGNMVIGDGCNPFCEVEPDCSGGPCVSACGDGIILPGDDEACDDGNTSDGDGCSADCEIEEGWTCEQVTGELPETLEVPVSYRDFIRSATDGNTKHPDFESFSGDDPTPGLVESDLGDDGKPVYAGICDDDGTSGCPFGQQMSTESNFNEWYADDHPEDALLVTRLSLGRVAMTEAYQTAPGSLFPLDDAGHVDAGRENAYEGHNFGFTSEIRNWFEFKGGESLEFSGDDDVWVFINGKLVLDLGGLHPRREGSFTLTSDGDAEWSRLMEEDEDNVVTETGTVDLGLETGKVYEIVLFHAERHTSASNFELTLAGFVSARSECESLCGDGVVVGDEVCDDGVNDGSYGSCTADCKTRGPFCGDGEIQDDDEACDDGINLTSYSMTNEPACAPGCEPSAFCGDGQVDALFGEACDDGTNDGGYGECAEGCVLGPRCGDGVVQADHREGCDDGNTVSGDGCSSTCLQEQPE